MCFQNQSEGHSPHGSATGHLQSARQGQGRAAGFGHSQLPPKCWVPEPGWLCLSGSELLSGKAPGLGKHQAPTPGGAMPFLRMPEGRKVKVKAQLCPQSTHTRPAPTELLLKANPEMHSSNCQVFCHARSSLGHLHFSC